MVYRRASRRSPRLLLRIVATAGVGALFGSGACGSDNPQPQFLFYGGSAPSSNEDAAADDSGTPTCHSMSMCGTGKLPDDGDDASVEGGDDGGNDGAADASDAADGGCSMVCGSVVEFPDASEDHTPPACQVTCGVHGIAPAMPDE